MSFLPITKEEMTARGWEAADFVYVTGDAYVDHPSFGPAIITRLLESQGYRVAVLAQPRFDTPEDMTRFGRPRLGFLVSGGNIDVNILNRVITRGLVMSGRKANMTIALEDKPGQLKKVAEIVSRCGSNVVSVQHDGSDPNMPISSCFLKLTLETRDAEQIEQIRAELAKEGFQLVSERV